MFMILEGTVQDRLEVAIESLLQHTYNPDWKRVMDA